MNDQASAPIPDTGRRAALRMVRRKVALTIGVGGTLGGGILLASNLLIAGAAAAVPLAANVALILGGAMFLREFRRTSADPTD